MTIADRFIIFFALLLIGGLYAIFWQNAVAGSVVRIRHDHHILNELSLDNSQTLRVEGELGESVIEVKDHQVRFASSPCPNKVCILHGWFNLQGEVMACIPNDVIVEILGKDARFDAIAF